MKVFLEKIRWAEKKRKIRTLVELKRIYRDIGGRTIISAKQ